MEYKFHYDAGHGWLEVPKREIEELNLQDKISGCSYINGDFIYLEEDCDFGVFAKAKSWTPTIWKTLIEEVDDGDSSIIRSYEPYKEVK